MWNAIKQEAVEVLWLASMVGGISLFCVAVAAALVAVPG